MDPLRRELLRFPRPDGGLDLVDLLFDRLVHLDAAEVIGLELGRSEALARVQALLLTDHPIVEDMRRAAWASRARGRPDAAAAAEIANIDWQEARALSPLIAEPWRDPERLRRLAEERAAGRRYLMLPGLVRADDARRLAAAADELAYCRMDTELVHAERCLLTDGALAEWQAFLAAPVTRLLFGAILGVELPDKTVANVWRLGRSDFFAVHPDGRLYRGTISLGLCDGWGAADGGAIAFGDPKEGGLEVRERWLPHAGDACLFAPDRTTFHAVEPVCTDRKRLSVTAWWLAPG